MFRVIWSIDFNFFIGRKYYSDIEEYFYFERRNHYDDQKQCKDQFHMRCVCVRYR